MALILTNRDGKERDAVADPGAIVEIQKKLPPLEVAKIVMSYLFPGFEDEVSIVKFFRLWGENVRSIPYEAFESLQCFFAVDSLNRSVASCVAEFSVLTFIEHFQKNDYASGGLLCRQFMDLLKHFGVKVTKCKECKRTLLVFEQTTYHLVDGEHDVDIVKRCPVDVCVRFFGLWENKVRDVRLAKEALPFLQAFFANPCYLDEGSITTEDFDPEEFIEYMETKHSWYKLVEGCSELLKLYKVRHDLCGQCHRSIFVDEDGDTWHDKDECHCATCRGLGGTEGSPCDDCGCR